MIFHFSINPYKISSASYKSKNSSLLMEALVNNSSCGYYIPSVRVCLPFSRPQLCPHLAFRHPNPTLQDRKSPQRRSSPFSYIGHLCRKINSRNSKTFIIHITMDYYSAIKRNASVLMRWMNLEPIIQSEVRQKEKDKYHILTRIYGI